jgi:hypothetical protein
MIFHHPGIAFSPTDESFISCTIECNRLFLIGSAITYLPVKAFFWFQADSVNGCHHININDCHAVVYHFSAHQATCKILLPYWFIMKYPMVSSGNQSLLLHSCAAWKACNPCRRNAIVFSTLVDQYACSNCC